MGVLVLYTEGEGQWYCRHVGANKGSYIVLYHACGHYKTVEYNGLRQFPVDHELVTGLLQYAATHVPQYPPEDDEDLAEMEAEAAESKAAGRSSAAVTVVSTAETSERASPLTTTPQTTRQRRSKRTPRGRGKATARRTLGFDQHEEATQPLGQPVEAGVATEGTRQLPPLIAQVAEHGPLYERVSFHNHAQWRAANEPLWNVPAGQHDWTAKPADNHCAGHPAASTARAAEAGPVRQGSQAQSGGRHRPSAAQRS